MEFSPDQEMKKIPELAREFFEHVLCDEYDPIFVSDEAKIWDVSMATPEDLMRRCSEYYGIPVPLEDFNKPLWKLLPELSAGRRRNDVGDRKTD